MSRIKRIELKKISDQRLWNLAVKNDESYIANGIVVHNCNSYLVPNFRNAKDNPEITGLKPSESAQKDISLKEIK